MSGQPALTSNASRPRVLVIDGEAEHEVFEVVDIAGEVVRVRSAFQFELGEELRVRIEEAGTVSDATARVRAHSGPGDARITELAISARSSSGPARP